MSIYQARRALWIGLPLMTTGFSLSIVSASLTWSFNGLTLLACAIMLAGIAAIAWHPKEES